MKNIFLSQKSGFVANANKNLFFNGYFYDNNNYISGADAFAFFENIKNINELKSVLKNCNGIYSLIIQINGTAILCTSHIRYFPLFYTKYNNEWIISDSANLLREKTGGKSLSSISVTEFLKQGYVRGNKTLYDGIFALQSAEIVCLENTPERHFYYLHPVTKFRQDDKSALESELKAVLNNIGIRLNNSLKGCTPVLPLSGGYDSRLIACLLKEAGRDDVICFSYGKTSRESEISESVAQKLGYKWLFIDYTKIDNIVEPLQSEEFLSYADYAANAVSMPFLQEFFAVRELKERKLIPENSVIIPGHSGDYPAGSFLGKNIFRSQKLKNINENILKTNCRFANPGRQEKRILLSEISSNTNEYLSALNNNNSIPYTIIEGIDMLEKLPKFVLNSSRVFNYFGYECRFPFWDYEFEMFFRNIAYELRLNKKLYDKVLEEVYFKPMGVKYDEELQPGMMAYTFENIKKPIKQFFPQKFKNSLIKKTDWMCYDEFTSVLQANLKKPLLKYNEYNAIICHWYIDRLQRLQH